MNIPTAGELRKMDGVEITAVTYIGIEISWIIVVNWDKVGIAHNNPKAWWYKIKEVPWYDWCWNLWTWWERDDYITDDITKIISLGQTKAKTLTYETQYLRSDWVVFTKDTIGWKKVEDLKQEMNNHVAEANKIRGLLKAHKNKFCEKILITQDTWSTDWDKTCISVWKQNKKWLSLEKVHFKWWMSD